MVILGFFNIANGKNWILKFGLLWERIILYLSCSKDLHRKESWYSTLLGKVSNGVNYLGYCHNSVLVLLSSSFVDILGAIFGKILKTISGTFFGCFGTQSNTVFTIALDQSSFDLVFINLRMRHYMWIGLIVGHFNQSFPTIFCLAYIKVAGEKPRQ